MFLSPESLHCKERNLSEDELIRIIHSHLYQYSLLQARNCFLSCRAMKSGPIMPPTGARVYCCRGFPDGFCDPARNWDVGSNSIVTQVPLNSPALRTALPVLFQHCWVTELTGYCADTEFVGGRNKTYTGYKTEIKNKKSPPISVLSEMEIW